MTESSSQKNWPPAFAAIGISFVTLAIAGNVAMNLSLPMTGAFAGVGVGFIVFGILLRFFPGIGRAIGLTPRSKP